MQIPMYPTKVVSSGWYKHRIKARYIAALLIIALLAMLSFMTFQRITTVQEQTLEFIRLNARQRTLSQRIAFLSSQLINDPAQRDANRAELRLLRDQMQANYQGILLGSFPDQDEPDVIVTVDEHLRSLYDIGDPSLVSLTENYIVAAAGLSDSPDDFLNDDNLDYNTIVDSSILLFERLDALISTSQTLSEQQFRLIQTEQAVLLAVTFVVLVLEGFLIFRPMEQQILKKEEALEGEAEGMMQLAEQLTRSEARYRLLLETMHEAFIIFDVDDNITYANNQFFNLVGYSGETTFGRSGWDFLDESSRPVILQQTEMRRRGESSSYEALFKHQDGRRIHTLISGSPIFDTQGVFQGSFVTISDITERKRSEEALRSSEARYRLLIDSMNEGFVTGDAQQRITYSNPQFAHMLGYTVDEIMGRTLSDFVDSTNSNIIREQWQQRQQGKSARYELAFRRKDGTRVFTVLAASPIKDAEGNFQGSSGVITDISEQKTMENALRRSEGLYRQLVQNMPDTAVMMFDRDLRFTLAEGPFLEMSGYNKAVMEGQTLHEIVPADAHTRLLPIYEAVLRGEEFQFEGSPVKHPHIIYHAHFTPLRDTNGQVTGGMIVSRNITQQKLAEQEIRDKEHLLRTVIDNLPSYVYVKDTESRFILANKAALPNLGMKSEAELIGKTDFDFQENAQYFRDFEIALMASDVPLLNQEESWVSQLTGETLWFLVNKIPLHDDSGKVIGLVGINHDITERKRMEATLQENEALLRQLMENIPDIFWITDVKTRRMLFVSPAYERIYGRPLETARLPLEERKQFVHPEDRETYTLAIRNILEMGHGEFEYRILRPNGDIRWLRSVNSPIFDNNGELYRIAIVTSDITERRRTEEMLRERQDFIERVTNAVPDVIYILDLVNGTTLYMNHPLEFSLGYSIEETVQMGESFLRILMHPEDLERQANLFNHVKVGENTIIENEYRLWHAKGEWRWFHSRDIVYEWTADGKPKHVLGITHDITQFKEAQAAIERSERLLRTVIDNAPMLIYAKDTDHRFVLASKSVIQSMNLASEAELLGKTDYDMFPPELAEQYHSDEQKVLDSGTARLNYEEYSLRHDTGKGVWFLTNKLPLRDGQGEVIGLVGMNYDITERKRIEDELREKQAFIERVTAAVPDLIYVYDLRTRENSYMNHPLSTTLGYPPADAAQMGNTFVMQVMYPDDLDRLPLLFAHVAVGESRIVENEYRLKAFDGSLRWFHSRDIVFEWDDDGRPRQVLGTARDVTEQKKAQAIAIQLESEKQRVQVLSNFIRDTSHDFRTPLTIIRTSIEIVKRLEDRDRRLDKIAKIERYLDYLVKLLDQLQLMATLDSATSLSLYPADVNPIVQALVENVQARDSSKELTFQLELQRGLPKVGLEGDTFIHAISNLLDNAATFTQAGGKITARTCLRDNNLLIEIADTGIGIKPDDLEHIFERFFKANEARTLATGGAGLGLSIVKRIIELHNGSIEVESEPGQGSLFRIVLPLDNGR